jgi:hypothetical protein
MRGLVPITPKVIKTAGYEANIYADALPAYPIEVYIDSLGVQDDDLRVKIGGKVVSDTRWNLGWYKGEDFLTSNVPPFPSYLNADHWRRVRVSKAQAAIAGSRMDIGDLVEVDVFDGWGGGWNRSKWNGQVTWSDGHISNFLDLGQTNTGFSTGSNPAVANPYNYGPHFISYYANGSFTIAR